MQLLALAGSFFLIICSVAARSTEFVGPCTKARQDAGQPMPGKFVPQCTEYGFFQPAQCHASTGKCWCVVPDNGKPVDGSIIFRSGEPKCTICLIKRSEALRPTGVVGNYVPQCGDDGLFTPTQRHGSTGHSWCVNPKTGEEIPGTRTGPSQPRVQCPSMLVDTMMVATSTGACFKEVEEKLTKQPLLGQELPQCNQENGDYLPVQYREGFSFCVNPKTGAVEGKKNAPGDKTPLPCVNPASTGACFKEVEEKRSKQPMLGQQLPQCNPENGDYLPVQYREGYSFCVNPKTGVVEGKVNRPGDNTPLPCVNPAVSAIAKPAGACLKEVEEKRSKQPLLGQQLPQCNPETGDYLPVQYREGYSFCVNPKTGALEGKINPPGDNTPLPCVNPAVAAFAKPAGACSKEVEEKRTKQPMLGQELPQCNPETGDYLPVQHKEGYSFCVNPKTGALEGKVNPPGDNTPLPCVNH